MLLRSIVVLSVAFSALSAAAAEKFVCVQYSRTSEKLQQNVVVLTKQDDGPLSEGDNIPFVLEQYKGIQGVPAISVEGKVSTEDVNFEFVSKDKKVKFHLYLDEAAEAGLRVNGVKKGDYICF